MPDDVKDGGASTATEDVYVPIEKMSPEDRAAFLKDGTLPRESKETPSDDGQKPVESGAASDAAKPKEEPKPKEEEPKRESRAERRIRKLNDEVKQLRAELAAKTETKPPAESKAVAEKTPSKAPKLKTFTDKIGQKDGYADWDTAHDAYENAVELYHEEQRKTAVLETLKSEREKQDQASAQELAKKELTKHAQAFADRSVEFRKTLGQDDFGEVFVEVKEAIDEVMAKRPEMATISNVFVRSKVGPELVYYYGKNPDELDALLELPLDEALIVVGEMQVSDKIQAPKPKTVTAATKTSTSVAGRQAVIQDALEAAVEKNDLMGYIQEANKRETGQVRAPRWGNRG